MTLEQLFSSMTSNPMPFTVFFLALPVIALLFNWIAKGVSHESPWKYIYSVLVYLTAIPAMFSIVLCLYSFFFQRQNLLQVNALIYFLPIVTMFASIFIISKEVEIDNLPGFKKLTALMLLLAVTFIAILIIEKTRIFVLFFGSMSSLFILFGILFLLFYFAWHRLVKH